MGQNGHTHTDGFQSKSATSTKFSEITAGLQTPGNSRWRVVWMRVRELLINHVGSCSPPEGNRVPLSSQNPYTVEEGWEVERV